MLDEDGEHLVDDLGEDGEEEEDAEHLVLHATGRVLAVEDRETDGESTAGGEQELGVDVRGAAPELLVETLGDLDELGPEGRRELLVHVRGALLASGSLDDRVVTEKGKLVLDTHVLRGRTPDSRPVDIRVGTRGSTDNLEHVLSRVGVVRKGRAAVANEVVHESLRVLADLTKVHGLAALGEQQQAVEALEQDGRGLVDGAQDSLAVAGELLHEVADGPRCLTVETGRGLVEEEQQLGTGSELDTDRQTLALLDVETLTGDTDDGVRVLLHVQEVDDGVDVGELLGLGVVRGLAEEGAEGEGFADGRGVDVDVLLLDVAGLALEGEIAGVAVDAHVAADNTHRHTAGEHVEKSRLTGSGDTLS